VTSSQFDGQFGSNGAILCEVKDLYLMMGKEFEILDEVPAGNMVGK
jgi:Translation elongation factors (GTPases)